MLALGCGLIASIGITQVLANRNKSAAGPTGDTQQVFVAMTDIGMGDSLTAGDLKLEHWPKDKVPQGAISRIEDIEGRRSRTKLYANEPILDNKLLGKGASEQGATALIPKGYRVVPVKVDLVSGGSSLILPGDRVDIMVHLFKDRNRGISETVTRTILQDVKIFAVNDVLGMDNSADDGKSIVAKTISLLVTPSQAAKVTLASQLGKIQLVMRSPEDDEQTPDAFATTDDLFGRTGDTRRQDESLMKDAGNEKQRKGFKEFLDSMKDKLAAGNLQPPAGEQSVWVIRMLAPGEVEEVRFEEGPGEPGSNQPQWQVKGTTANPAPRQPAMQPPKVIEKTAPTPAAKPSEPQGPKLGPEKTTANFEDTSRSHASRGNEDSDNEN